MLGFVDVVRYLDDSVGGANESVGAHDAFWRNTSRDEFVALTIFGVDLVTLGDGSGSGLVKSLKGEEPFGRDTGNPAAPFRLMPSGLPPMPEDRIKEISEWIDEDYPE